MQNICLKPLVLNWATVLRKFVAMVFKSCWFNKSTRNVSCIVNQTFQLLHPSFTNKQTKFKKIFKIS